MSARVICLSRAIWASADEVADLVAKELGFQCVDEEIISRAAERQKLEPAAVADAEMRKSFFARMIEEIGRSGGLVGYGVAYMPDPDILPPRDERLRALIREAIVETADQGDVVIVAHAASYALGERDDVLRVLVTGSLAVRAERLALAEGMSLEDAEEAIEQSDEDRADYLERFYEVDQEVPEHYDICVSTDVLAPAQAAELIVSAARAIYP
jgi:hypothetical protein